MYAPAGLGGFNGDEGGRVVPQVHQQVERLIPMHERGKVVLRATDVDGRKGEPRV